MNPSATASRAAAPRQGQATHRRRDFGLPAVLILAGIPSLLTFAERWLGNESLVDLVHLLWCRQSSPCAGSWPVTTLLLALMAVTAFLVARRPTGRIWPDSVPPVGPRPSRPGILQLRLALAVSLVCGVGLLLVATRSRLSGTRLAWDYASLYLSLIAAVVLHEVPLADLGPSLVTGLRQAAAPLATHILLVAALFAATTRLPSAPVLLTLALVAHLALWRQRGRTITPVFWLVSVSLILWSLYLTAWWFSVIGDEYAFYRYARGLLGRADLASIGAELYNAAAVYSAHPGFSSLIQAASMALFGPGLFGWRFSNGYLAALSLWPFYSFIAALGGRRQAILASSLLAASHYLMSFGKIGYNNLQALFTFTLCLAAASWFARRPSTLAAAGFGTALGMNFFVFPVALLTLPVALVVATLGNRNRPPRAAWLTVGLALLATALPIVLQEGFWLTKQTGSLSLNPTAALTIGGNLALSIPSFVRVPGESHFVAVGLVDLLTATFVVLGVGAALRPPIHRRAATLLASSALLLLLVGGVHGYATPPLTRMFLLLPALAGFGALGLRWLEESLSRGAVHPSTARRITLAVLGAILLANLLQAYPLSRQRMAGHYQSPQVLLLREADTLLTSGATNAHLVLLALPERNLRSSLLEYLELNLGRFDETFLVERNPLEVTDGEIRDPRAILMVDHRLPDTVQTQLEARLTNAGKTPCRFRNSLGDVRLVVWTAPAERYRCAEAAYRW